MLLIHRWNEGREYFVVPGGGVDEGETPEQTAVREVKEETNVDAVIGERFFEFSVEDDGFGHPQHNIFFLSREFSGKEEFGVGGPEKDLESTANRYRLEWVPLTEISGTPLVPDQIKIEIVARSKRL